MKCPKCGSTDICTELRPDGFNTCLKCGYKRQHGGKLKLKLTTAEMLLFITEGIGTIFDKEAGDD